MWRFRLILLLAFVLSGASMARAQTNASVVGSGNIGTTTTAAVTGDANGTLIGHVRFLDKVFNDVWDSVNHRMNIAVANGSTTVTDAAHETAGVSSIAITSAYLKVYGLGGSSTWDRLTGGQQTMTNSLPVVLASNHTDVPVALKAQTSGGATPGYYVAAASNNSTNLKASAGTVYSLVVINTTATLKYLRLIDSASAPTCTSSTGLVFYVPIPANSTTGAGFAAAFPVGKNFANGIGWCITAGSGVTDNTSTSAGDVIVNYDYK